MTRQILLTAVFLAACLLSACGQQQEETSALSQLTGSILVWHTWPEPDSLLINDLLNSFTDVHPDVTIVSEHVPATEIGDRFTDQAQSGLGPDLIIGADVFLIKKLAEQNLLLNFHPDSLETNELLPTALNALSSDDQLYAVPFSAYTSILYYNKEQVDPPATDLDSLLQAAKNGQIVALPTSFRHAFWGAKAHGSAMLAEEGNIVIDNSFINWLDWLLTAQNEPTMILSSSYADLYTAFVDGEALYFVGQSSDLPKLIETMGEEKVGLSQLPTAVSSAGSFLEIDTIIMNRLSAEKQLGHELIQFLINRPSQRRIALNALGKIPMNQRVTFDRRLAPIPATLLRQSRSAVIVPLTHVEAQQHLFNVGDEIYLQVLSGVLAPADAATELHDGLIGMLAPANTTNETTQLLDDPNQ